MPRENVLTCLLADLGKTNAIDCLGDALFAFGKAKTDQPRGVAQIVSGGEIVIEADRIGQITNTPLHRERFARRIEPEHAHLSCRDVGKTEHHQDGGGLAGAVRAQQTEDLSAPDGERDAIDGHRRSIVFGEARGLDDGVLVHRRPNLATAPTITNSATPMMPTPAIPHMVEVVTVTRKFAEADSPRADARTVVT